MGNWGLRIGPTHPDAKQTEGNILAKRSKSKKKTRNMGQVHGKKRIACQTAKRKRRTQRRVGAVDVDTGRRSNKTATVNARVHFPGQHQNNNHYNKNDGSSNYLGNP